jgi:signal transduction histidine kinase
MFVSVSFSLVIYGVLTREVDRFSHMQGLRIERRMLIEQGLRPRNQPMSFKIVDLDLVREVKQRTIIMLGLINVIILVVSGILGYLLAGKTLQPIKEMVDEQNRFISDASHELRTPLTSLKTAMEVSLRDKNLSLNEAKKTIIESIGEADNLQSLSDKLLQLAQYQKINKDLVSLAIIANEAVNKVRPLAQKKKIIINNKVDNGEIKGDKQGLIELLVIFLDNAVKYSPEKSKVFLSSKKTDRSISVSIKDQGIGIEKKDLPHIFDRFYRADSARSKTNTGGYGLGLSIAKKIIDIHQGSVKIDSAPKKGTTFAISFPVLS